VASTWRKRLLTTLYGHARAGAVTAIVALLTTGGERVRAADYVVRDYAIAEPLSAMPGDPQRGAAIVVDRGRGNCLSCHAVPVDADFFGTTGPTLAAVGARLNAAQLRLRLVDPKVINPMTMMPAYFNTEGLYRVAPEYAGKPILSAQEIEDVVAFLLTLK